MELTLNIIASGGVRLHEEHLERVVVRRREAQHDPGSEVAILPLHGPLLMQTQPCTLRFTREGVVHEASVGAGVLEVFRDRVRLVET